jgi:hypothetical protein
VWWHVCKPKETISSNFFKLLTIIHGNKMDETWLSAMCNGSNCCAAYHHAKWCVKWQMLWGRYNEDPEQYPWCEWLSQSLISTVTSDKMLWCNDRAPPDGRWILSCDSLTFVWHHRLVHLDSVTMVLQCSSTQIFQLHVTWQAYFYVMKYECDSILLHISLPLEHLWITR